MYNNSLYFNIDNTHDEDFFEHVDTYLQQGEAGRSAGMASVCAVLRYALLCISSLYFGFASPDLCVFMLRSHSRSCLCGITAEARWTDWFGSLQAGVFNWSCMSSKGWSFQDCISDGQDPAPLASRGVTQSCGVVPNGH